MIQFGGGVWFLVRKVKAEKMGGREGVGGSMYLVPPPPPHPQRIWYQSRTKNWKEKQVLSALTILKPKPSS